jgi:hypothetical protein
MVFKTHPSYVAGKLPGLRHLTQQARPEIHIIPIFVVPHDYQLLPGARISGII